MTPLFVAFLGPIKEEGRSCLPRRWFNGLGYNNAATFKPSRGAHYMGLSQSAGLWTFPLEHRLNGGDGRGGPGRAYRGEKGDHWGDKQVPSAPPVPPHLASRQLGASPCTKGKFSVSGWLKMLTLEETIEGNINTVDHGTVHSSCPAPFPLTKFLFLSVLFSFWLHSSPTSLISQTLQFRPFFPYLAKGRMTRIKLVLARPKGFVLSGLWQVTVATMRWIINQQPILSGDLTYRH